MNIKLVESIYILCYKYTHAVKVWKEHLTSNTILVEKDGFKMLDFNIGLPKIVPMVMANVFFNTRIILKNLFKKWDYQFTNK